MAEESKKSDAALREERILAFWKERGIFGKTLQKESPNGEFVFYEGPPTANAEPALHHLEARAFKDAVPRYKTMQGFRVARRAGWDTHGLPVELQIEKELGFTGKPDIEKFGIAEFNKKCRESVYRFIEVWGRFTERIGYWVDQSKAYFTFDSSYMESLWAITKKVSDDGRLYKDYKVLPWCVQCGTALSSHELAQGYEDVKDLTITAKFELIDEPGTHLLAWTTTPWTLPGNVALAVGKDISYGTYEKEGERVIVAEALAEKVLGEEWAKEKVLAGKELVGKRYKPLYPFVQELASDSEKEKFNKAYQVYAADFVTTEDGTGIVHTAVMYGADDFALGNEIGLPKVHLVAPDGRFVSGTGFLEDMSVIDSETNVSVLKDLQEKGMFFSKSNYVHSYPHCWRSKNRLIYYARDSWYIRMQDLKETLLMENAKVAWEPSHIRDGRMGEWLSNVKDWAISRERYWGTPLPVWESDDGQERVVIGSIEELKEQTVTSGNTYYLMRHGEAEHNVENRLNSIASDVSALTDNGKKEVEDALKELRARNITKIFHSPLQRTRETTEIVANALGIPPESVIEDARLREFGFGDLEGKSLEEFSAFRNEYPYDERIAGGESYQDVKNRFGEFLYALEAQESKETILIITHGAGFEVLAAVVEGADKESSKKLIAVSSAKSGEVRELSFASLPHNEDYELDLHRPYIDAVSLKNKTGAPLHRVKEVMDVWFDSGAMPFAQDHYPFENKEDVEGPGYPADFISEAIDQTRGWFYTLLAIGVLMGRGVAYKNVICLGHLLDGEGKKMSKSKGNIINPWEAVDMYGADVLRFWMYSVNQAGDSKSFDAKTVKESARTLSWLENSAKFYELFATDVDDGSVLQIIDEWMQARTNETIQQVTAALDSYQLYSATRSLSALFEDLSQWYVRRVRERVRAGDYAALQTLRPVLRASALMLAPFSPFLAEDIFQMVRYEADPESVHLAPWPIGSESDENLLVVMKGVREQTSLLLKKRQEAGILLRQPLASATVTVDLPPEFTALIAEEANVKKIRFGEDVSLDTVLTPELIKEGDERAFDRAVAEARKEMNLSPKDSVTVVRGEGPYSAELSTGTVKFSVTKNAS